MSRTRDQPSQALAHGKIIFAAIILMPIAVYFASYLTFYKCDITSYTNSGMSYGPKLRLKYSDSRRLANLIYGPLLAHDPRRDVWNGDQNNIPGWALTPTFFPD